MTLKELSEIWKSGIRSVWYAYDGLFSTMKVWDLIYRNDDELSYCILNHMLGNEGFINMYIPLDVILDLVPCIPKHKMEFQVYWNCLPPDICGHGSIGSLLTTAENNENVFLTYDECVEECEKRNRKRTIHFNSDQLLTLHYLRLLRKAVNACYRRNNFGNVKTEINQYTIAALQN